MPGASSGPREASIELDDFPPVRDLRVEAERPDLRLDRDLGIRVAVDEEHPTRVAGVARPLALGEVPQPCEELVLVGVGREAADRSDLTANATLLAVDPDLLGALLEVRAQRPLP